MSRERRPCDAPTGEECEATAGKEDPAELASLLKWILSSTLWVILCRLPEKGRKEILKETIREEIGTESEETEEIKTFPLYPYLLQG